MPQAEHYAYRDKELETVNFDEFTMGFRLEKATAEVNQPHKGGGRPLNFSYELENPHDLAGKYCIKTLSKYLVPIFVGDPPPRAPKPLRKGQKDNPSRRRKMDLVGDYYLALFRPWSFKEISKDSLLFGASGWAEWQNDLEKSARSRTDSVERTIARGRLFRIAQVRDALVVDSKQAKLLTHWRNRNRTWWDSSTPLKDGEPVDRDLLRDIADLQTRVAPFTASDVNRRAQAESWVDRAEQKVKSMHIGRGTIPQAEFDPKESKSSLQKNAKGEQYTPMEVEAFLERLKEPRVPNVPDAGGEEATGVTAGRPDDLPGMPDDFAELSLEEYNAQAKEWSTLPPDSRPPPPLNIEQRSLCRKRFEMVRILDLGRRLGEDPTVTLGRLEAAGFRQINLTQGGAGMGKSLYILRLRDAMRRYGLGEVVPTAWTGVAAAPYAAATLCALLKLRPRHLSGEQKLDETGIAGLRADFARLMCDPEKLRILVVDEVSFLIPEVLHHIEFRLRILLNRPEVPFGGIILELIGDFWQKEPARSGKGTMAEELVRADAPLDHNSFTVDEGSPKAKGLSIFRNARRFVLTRQMRAADDPPFQEDQLALRRTDVAYPVPESLVNSLEEVKTSDLRHHPPFAFAAIGVLGNSERERLNFAQAEQFARWHRRPLIIWRHPLAEADAEALGGLNLNDLYRSEKGMLGVFVKGAPAMLLKNIQSTKALVNGSVGKLHSLTFSGDFPSQITTAERMGEYDLIELPEPPYCVNFEVTLPDGDNGDGIETLLASDGTRRRIVVPILTKDGAHEHHLSSLYSAMAGIPKVLRVFAPWLTLAFALTDFKLQGRTLGELILSIAPRPFPPHLDLRGFYVFVSRVRQRSRLRVLFRPSDVNGGCSFLLKLQHLPELGVWDRGYDSKGDWSPTLAMEAAEAMRLQRSSS